MILVRMIETTTPATALAITMVSMLPSSKVFIVAVVIEIEDVLGVCLNSGDVGVVEIGTKGNTTMCKLSLCTLRNFVDLKVRIA